MRERVGPADAGEAPLLVMERITKTFPGVRALSNVDLELRRGEVLALLGENGAGKSTLIKILAGAHLPDDGTIRMEGRLMRFERPAEAQRAGISVIYQEFNLVPSLSVRENLFLGREQSAGGFIRRTREREEAEGLFGRIGLRIDPEALCRDLSVGQQQVVEIAKALAQEARVVVMDEPSAALTLQEVERLFAVIRELKSRGLGIIYISHRLEEIFSIADRVMVMRDGRHVGTRPIGEINRKLLIEMMVGRTLESEFPNRTLRSVGAERLAVRNLRCGRRVRDVTFSIRAGEIVGLTGLIGSGRTETARLIFGADRPDGGTIRVNGRPVRFQNPRQAIAEGIAFLTEDRKGQGLILNQPVRENFGLPNLRHFGRFGFVRRKTEADSFGRYAVQLRIRMADQEEPVRNLSGGNQQKVVLAKWLQRNCSLVIFDEPTRGIDVGAKFEVYELMQGLAADGKAILMISSELAEIMGMSDRILVMREGRIAGEFEDGHAATQETIMQLAVGG